MSKPSKFSESIIYNGETLEVSGTYYPATRGAREYGTGLQLEPDEPAEIEIESIIFSGVEVIGLMETAMQQIDSLVWESFHERINDYDYY